MRYEGTVYRPPSEAGSLIIQLTIGCARNTCTFCNMYKDKKFRIRPLEEVAEDLEMARKYYSHIKVRRIFLADGDALIVKTQDLLYILDKCHEYFPEVERISVYGAPKDILGKTPEELKQLKDAGLDMVYMGLESGDDEGSEKRRDFRRNDRCWHQSQRSWHDSVHDNHFRSGRQKTLERTRAEQRSCHFCHQTGICGLFDTDGRAWHRALRPVQQRRSGTLRPS